MQTAKTKSKNVERYYQEAQRLALEVVEERARAILRAHKGSLREFIMAMGTWGFTSRAGNDVNADYVEKSSLANFIGHWDEYLKLTGEPMRFTATGPKVNRW